MLSIGIQYLTGVVSAKRIDDRDRCEWPPHPDRVFMALTAGAAEQPAGALGWLEQQGAPAIFASRARFRTTRTSFVPINDVSVASTRRGLPKAATAQRSLSIVPDFNVFRNQARSFVACIPDHDTVHMIWSDAEATVEVRAQLEEICSRVSYLGDSSSLVRMWVDDNPPQPSWMPASGNTAMRMRVPFAGRLNQLRACYQRSLETGEVIRPPVSTWVGYAPQQQVPTHAIANDGEFSGFVPLELTGRGVDVTQTLKLTKAVRRLMLGACPDPIPEWVSGHRADGSVSRESHVGVVGLPFMGNRYSDGRIVGAALVLPRGVAAGDRARCLGGFLLDQRGVPIERQVAAGVTVRLPTGYRATLDEQTWCAASDCWATATPIALHRWPKGNLEAMLCQSCQHAGLPEPSSVTTSHVSPLRGAPHVRQFPNRHHHPRFLTHAILRWDQPIRGPVVIGAGRYCGYGLMKPWEGTGRER